MIERQGDISQTTKQGRESHRDHSAADKYPGNDRWSKTSPEHRERWRGGDIRRQTDPSA